MSEFFQTTHVKKARKDHRCSLCEDIILKGVPYVKQSGVYEGDFFEHKHHEVCDKWLERYLSENGYGEYSIDVFQEWMYESNCFKCEHYQNGDCDLDAEPYTCLPANIEVSNEE